MGRTDNFVMLPAASIAILPISVGLKRLTMVICKRVAQLLEIKEPIKKLTHTTYSCCILVPTHELDIDIA
jgi:hypothetical protein